MAVTSLTKELNRLDTCLVGASVSSFWTPGLTPEEISKLVNGVIDTPLPAEALAWYGWHGRLDTKRLEAARNEQSGYVYSEFTPDGLVHAGLDQIIPKIAATLNELNCSISQLWPGHEVFPIAIDYDAGIHWLQRRNHEEPWTLWQSGKEWELQPHWNVTESMSENGPTLEVWVIALNDAFDRGDVTITDDGGIYHRKASTDDRYACYPWPDQL